jgi:hypothetical protein
MRVFSIPREERRPAARDGTAFGGVMRSQMTQSDIMLRQAHAEVAL